MTRTRRRSFPAALKPYAWTLGVLWGLPLVAVGIGYLLLPHEVPAGQCSGLGFGCTLSLADTMLLLLVMVGPVLVTVGAIACAVIALLQLARGSARTPSQRDGG
jgi:hypothetical protein